MNCKNLKIIKCGLPLLFLNGMMTPVQAEETIIKNEKMSFEICLSVITTSASKLAIAPEISDVSDQKRIAIFKLPDGILTISCKGDEERIIVSTETN